MLRFLALLRTRQVRLAPPLRAVVEGDILPPSQEWPGALAAALREELERRPSRCGRGFILLVDTLVRLDAFDVLEELVRDPAPRPVMLHHLKDYLEQCPPGLRSALVQLVATALRRRPNASALPYLPPAMFGLLSGGSSTPPPGLSLVVVARGRAFQAMRLLASVGASARAVPLEVLLHINGPMQVEEAAVAALLGPGVSLRLTRSAAPEPIGVVRNRLVAAATYEQVLSLDADMVLLRAPEALCREAQLDAATPPTRFWSLGYLGLRDLVLAKLVKYCDVAPGVLRNRSLLRLGAAELEVADGQVVPGNRMSGGASLFPRGAFLELGGFSEEFDIGWEDVEFSLRLARSGRLVLNPLATPLFHGHLMPFTAEDLAVESERFSPARYEAGLRVFARDGLVPDRAADAGEERLGGDSALRRCPFKLALLEGLGLPMVTGLQAGPVVAWVASAAELAEGRLRTTLAGAPRLWRNVVLTAPEVASLPRLAANLAGVDAVVLGAGAAAYLAGRPEPFAPSFAAFNRAFPATILSLGEAVGATLRRLYPAATVEEMPGASPTAVWLALAKAAVLRRQQVH